MSKFDYEKLILQTMLDNSCKEVKDVPSGEILTTEDFFFLPSKNDVKNLSEEERQVYSSDYALLNGAPSSFINDKDKNRRHTVTSFLRSGEKDKVNVIYYVGLLDLKSPTESASISVDTRIDVKEFLTQVAKDNSLLKMDTVKNSNGKILYHTIEFGEFPQKYVGTYLNKRLESKFQNNQLQKTGKKYFGNYDARNNRICECEEFLYDGQKYVRVNAINNGGISRLSTDYHYVNGEKLWCRVEPIQWRIVNFDDMPVEINPKGKGGNGKNLTTTEMHLRSDCGLISMPFYKGKLTDKNNTLWQNSTIRGYLNGINVNNIATNGNALYPSPNGGDFSSGCSFSKDAFDVSLERVYDYNNSLEKKMSEDKKKRKGYGVVVEDIPLSVKDQMKFYIENNKAFMLHGPSGIGKTRRVEELDPNLVSLVLRKGMLPEEAIGKTIYPNSESSDGGIWKAPSWYVKLCEEAEKKGDKKQILFLDELTNSLYEQNLVFHLVLNRCIQPNLGHLPDNVVVVAAGNNQEESSSAYNMTEPLFRRFDGHIYLKPNIPEWLEWGSEESGKGDGRLKVHPLIANFVSTYGKKIFYSNYDRDNPPEYVLDPRGWEQVSDIIYDNDGVISRELIENKVGKAIATNLIAFAKQPVITLEDVVEGNYNKNEIPKKYDQKYAMAMSLRYAKEDEVGTVREFVRDNLGEEMLSTFDSVWVGEDSEKAILVNTLEKEHQEELERQLQETENPLISNSKSEVEEDVNIPNNMRSTINVFYNGAFDITLDDFFDAPKLRYISCDEKWKADILTRAFHNRGNKWQDGDSYFNNPVYNMYSEGTCYSNVGAMASLKSLGTKEDLLAKNIDVYEFEKVDISKYISKKELMELLPKPNFEITIDDFWNAGQKNLFIHCDEEWKAHQLMKVFARMGKKWPATKTTYSSENSCYEIYGSDTCYSNYGTYNNLKVNANDGIVYEFEKVDISKYMSKEEREYSSMPEPDDAPNSPKGNFEITIDQFWRDGNLLYIHCDEEWKANYLTAVLHRMNKKWANGESYAICNNYSENLYDTCYGNNASFASLDYAKKFGRGVYKFENVDLSKYLQEFEIKDIYEHLPAGSNYADIYLPF